MPPPPSADSEPRRIMTAYSLVLPVIAEGAAHTGDGTPCDTPAAASRPSTAPATVALPGHGGQLGDADATEAQPHIEEGGLRAPRRASFLLQQAGLHPPTPLLSAAASCRSLPVSGGSSSGYAGSEGTVAELAGGSAALVRDGEREFTAASLVMSLSPVASPPAGAVRRSVSSSALPQQPLEPARLHPQRGRSSRRLSSCFVSADTALSGIVEPLAAATTPAAFRDFARLSSSMASPGAAATQLRLVTDVASLMMTRAAPAPPSESAVPPPNAAVDPDALTPTGCMQPAGVPSAPSTNARVVSSSWYTLGGGGGGGGRASSSMLPSAEHAGGAGTGGTDGDGDGERPLVRPRTAPAASASASWRDLDTPLAGSAPPRWLGGSSARALDSSIGTAATAAAVSAVVIRPDFEAPATHEATIHDSGHQPPCAASTQMSFRDASRLSTFSSRANDDARFSECEELRSMASPRDALSTHSEQSVSRSHSVSSPGGGLDHSLSPRLLSDARTGALPTDCPGPASSPQLVATRAPLRVQPPCSSASATPSSSSAFRHHHVHHQHQPRLPGVGALSLSVAGSPASGGGYSSASHDLGSYASSGEEDDMDDAPRGGGGAAAPPAADVAVPVVSVGLAQADRAFSPSQSGCLDASPPAAAASASFAALLSRPPIAAALAHSRGHATQRHGGGASGGSVTPAAPLTRRESAASVGGLPLSARRDSVASSHCAVASVASTPTLHAAAPPASSLHQLPLSALSLPQQHHSRRASSRVVSAYAQPGANPYSQAGGIQVIADNALAAAVNIAIKVWAANLPGGSLFPFLSACAGLAEQQRQRTASSGCFATAASQQQLLSPAPLAGGGGGGGDHAANAAPFRLGVGLHIGWAIEGAIGSAIKMDATYLSPSVNITARLESATRIYGCDVLVSQAFAECLSQPAQNLLRLLDRVQLAGVSAPFHVYTLDWDHAAARGLLARGGGGGGGGHPPHPQRRRRRLSDDFGAALGQRGGAHDEDAHGGGGDGGGGEAAHGVRFRSGSVSSGSGSGSEPPPAALGGDGGDTSPLVSGNPTVADLALLQPEAAFPPDFFEHSELAVGYYLGDPLCDWQAARAHAEAALALVPGDGPLRGLLRFMSEQGAGAARVAPHWWRGFRSLDHK